VDLLSHEPPVQASGLPHRPPIYDSKTAFEGLDLAPLMTSASTLNLPVQVICRKISGSDFEWRRHETF